MGGSELKGAAQKQKEHVGSDSGYEENGSNTSKSHILNIKVENASELKGTECYVKIYVNSKKVATSKAQKDPFQWDESFKTKVDFPSDGKISVQVYEKKTKDELLGQDEKEMNTLNIGST